MEDELKTWLAVRTDLTMPRGKFAAQAGHGYAGVLYETLKTNPELAHAYMDGGAMAKVTVEAKNESALRRIFETAVQAGIGAYLVTDAGRTVFPEPTLTVCAFGPCRRSQLPPYLGRLRLLMDKEC